MIHTITQTLPDNTEKAIIFNILDSVKIRQAQELLKISKLHGDGDIDDIEMAVRTVSIMLVSIDDLTDKSKFYDYIMDNLETEQMTELSEKVMDVVNGFVKKNKTLNMSMKPSSIEAVEA